MDCPRCGTRLTRISLNGERQSVYCERCRFADVESDHTRASAGGESWDDALRRFRTANAGESGESDGNTDTAAASDGDDSGGSHSGDPGADAAGAAPDESDAADATGEASGSDPEADAEEA